MVHRDRPWNLGLLYDWFAEADRPTVMHLDRPFDIAPDAGTRFDGAGLADLVREASGWLRAAGLRHGDRVAIVKDNHYDMPMIAAAAARIGALPAVIAPLTSVEAVRTMIRRVDPALVVASPGMLSFPRPGLTLALDFRNRSARTLALLARLDAIVAEAGGGLYPAKDQRMPRALFVAGYPALERFGRQVDPSCQSEFWKKMSS